MQSTASVTTSSASCFPSQEYQVFLYRQKLVGDSQWSSKLQEIYLKGIEHSKKKFASLYRDQVAKEPSNSSPFLQYQKIFSREGNSSISFEGAMALEQEICELDEKVRKNFFRRMQTGQKEWEQFMQQQPVGELETFDRFLFKEELRKKVVRSLAYADSIKNCHFGPKNGDELKTEQLNQFYTIFRDSRRDLEKGIVSSLEETWEDKVIPLGGRGKMDFIREKFEMNDFMNILKKLEFGWENSNGKVHLLLTHLWLDARSRQLDYIQGLLKEEIYKVLVQSALHHRLVPNLDGKYYFPERSEHDRNKSEILGVSMSVGLIEIFKEVEKELFHGLMHESRQKQKALDRKTDEEIQREMILADMEDEEQELLMQKLTQLGEEKKELQATLAEGRRGERHIRNQLAKLEEIEKQWNAKLTLLNEKIERRDSEQPIFFRSQTVREESNSHTSSPYIAPLFQSISVNSQKYVDSLRAWKKLMGAVNHLCLPGSGSTSSNSPTLDPALFDRHHFELLLYIMNYDRDFFHSSWVHEKKKLFKSLLETLGSSSGHKTVMSNLPSRFVSVASQFFWGCPLPLYCSQDFAFGLGLSAPDNIHFELQVLINDYLKDTKHFEERRPLSPDPSPETGIFKRLSRLQPVPQLVATSRGTYTLRAIFPPETAQERCLIRGDRLDSKWREVLPLKKGDRSVDLCSDASTEVVEQDIRELPEGTLIWYQLQKNYLTKISTIRNLRFKDGANGFARLLHLLLESPNTVEKVNDQLSDANALNRASKASFMAIVESCFAEGPIDLESFDLYKRLGEKLSPLFLKDAFKLLLNELGIEVGTREGSVTAFEVDQSFWSEFGFSQNAVLPEKIVLSNGKSFYLRGVVSGRQVYLKGILGVCSKIGSDGVLQIISKEEMLTGIEGIEGAVVFYDQALLQQNQYSDLVRSFEMLRIIEKKVKEYQDQRSCWRTVLDSLGCCVSKLKRMIDASMLRAGLLRGQ